MSNMKDDLLKRSSNSRSRFHLSVASPRLREFESHTQASLDPLAVRRRSQAWRRAARMVRLSARDPSRTVLPVRRSLLVVIAAIRTVPLAAVQVHAHPYRGEREPNVVLWPVSRGPDDLIWGHRVRRMVGPFTCSTSHMQFEDPSMAGGQGRQM